MHHLYPILLFLLPLVSVGQNLVPNGSFEQLDSCPSGNGCIGLLEYATGWFEPTNCTSDLFNICAGSGHCGLPTYEGALPFEGDGMAHIGLFSVSWQPNEGLREYASIKLLSPLMSDSLYQIHVKLHLFDSYTIAVGSFGAYFSNDSATNYSINHDLIGLQPQLQRDPNSLMDNPEIWYVWEDTLEATGGEQFMMIGNFLNDQQTPRFPSGSLGEGSGYFIDDVRLTPIPKPRPNSLAERNFQFSIYPNPATDNLRIESQTPLAQVRLTDLAGRPSVQQTFRQAQGDVSIDASNLPSGIYLLEAITQDGRRSVQKVVVQ